MRPTTWRRSTHIVIGVAVVLVVAAVVVAAALLRGDSSDADAIPAAPAPAAADPGIKPVSDSADKPTRDKLAATLALALADPNLGAFTGRIADAATGEQLWAQGADLPMQPGLGDQGADHRGGAAGARPRRPSHHRRWWRPTGVPASSCSRAAATRRCRPRRREPTPGTAARRASATSPTRCAAAAPR